MPATYSGVGCGAPTKIDASNRFLFRMEER
jgi:hypothetical protein